MMPSMVAMPNSATKPIAAETLNGRAGQIEREDAADQRHRNDAGGQQTSISEPKLKYSSSADQQQAQRHDDRQPLQRVLQIAELADPFQPVAARQRAPARATLCCASSTALPRSRPRTLNLIGM